MSWRRYDDGRIKISAAATAEHPGIAIETSTPMPESFGDASARAMANAYLERRGIAWRFKSPIPKRTRRARR